MTTSDFLFYVFAVLAVGASFGVAVSRNPLHGAVSLLLSLFAVAALFAWAGAHFLAAMQVLVYAGAIAVLFVFVIMLLNLSERELGGLDPGRAQYVGLACVLIGLVAFSTVAMTTHKGFPGATGDQGTVKNMGTVLLSRYAAPFEVISLLLLASMCGAVMLTKRAHGQEDTIASIEKIRRVIDARSRRAFLPDPSQPSQQGPPAKQAPPPTDAPPMGVVQDTNNPGDTV